jgi:hypothetical protein
MNAETASAFPTMACVQRKPDPAPYEGDVARIVTLGSLGWLVLGLALLPFWSRLEDDGHLWWIATCAWGAGLGLTGRALVLRRDRRLRS